MKKYKYFLFIHYILCVLCYNSFLFFSENNRTFIVFQRQMILNVFKKGVTHNLLYTKITLNRRVIFHAVQFYNRRYLFEM